jgi:four helix bundle protein
MQDFRRLHVWQKAHALLLLTNDVFTARRCRTVPWLRSQVLRAAASISANIAEGCGKQTSKELLRFTNIAFASAQELENHFVVARDLGVISTTEFVKLAALVVEVKRMLMGFAKAIGAQSPKPTTGATRRG